MRSSAPPKSLDAVVLARALQGYALPPDLALDPHRAFFREADHELMSTVLVGEVHLPGATTRAQEAALQIARISATVPVRSSHHPQYVQRDLVSRNMLRALRREALQN